MCIIGYLLFAISGGRIKQVINLSTFGDEPVEKIVRSRKIFSGMGLRPGILTFR